jgi:hypothetical protein
MLEGPYASRFGCDSVQMYPCGRALFARVQLEKSDVTFSDAITAVRRWLWVEWVFAMTGHREAFQKLGRPLRQILLQGLAPAA